MTPLIIAIDGPSGAGKGTLARRLAEALGYRHIDTGAMYRAVAWKAHQVGMALDDETALATLAEQADLRQGGGLISIDGADVTRAIRTAEMDHSAARVARLPAVRAVLVARQRALGEGGGVVMEGRDIGTVVFPNADLKFYLDASPDARARRRAQDESHSGGQEGNVARLRTEMAARDQSDTTRKVAPLQMAVDGIYVDTTELDAEQVFQVVLSRVGEAGTTSDESTARTN